MVGKTSCVWLRANMHIFSIIIPTFMSKYCNEHFWLLQCPPFVVIEWFDECGWLRWSSTAACRFGPQLSQPSQLVPVLGALPSCVRVCAVRCCGLLSDARVEGNLPCWHNCRPTCLLGISPVESIALLLLAIVNVHCVFHQLVVTSDTFPVHFIFIA